MKTSAASNLKWFLLIFLGAAVLWHSVFHLLCKPGKTETLQLFVTASACDSKAIRESLSDIPVQQITVASQSTGSSNYNDYLTTVGILNSDLLILDSTIFEVEYAWQEFAPLEEAFLKQYGLDLGSLTPILCQEKAYGIVIYDREAGIDLLSGLFTPCDENRQYCLVINRNLPNAGPYSQGNETTDHAFRAFAALLGAQ